MATPRLPPTSPPTTLLTTLVHPLRCVIWLIGATLGQMRGAPEKVVEQKGVGRRCVGTQNKKPKKIWVIPVNTRGKK